MTPGPDLDFPAQRRSSNNRDLTPNDVHSRLNATQVEQIVAVRSVTALRAAVLDAAGDGVALSMCGGRHAMGGQQFGTRMRLLDLRGMDRVLEVDHDRGLVTVEAGIDWPHLVTHLLWAGAGLPQPWGIIQKQTGADRLTIGGALSANIHGRGLKLRPIVADVESFDLMDGSGTVLRCSRTVNPDLFTLAIGGYGLFGPIVRATLRLAPRRKMVRRVTIARVDDLPDLFQSRMDDGYEYGDFQFATDPATSEFLNAGVFSCYEPAGIDSVIPGSQRALGAADFRRLLLLAHTQKSAAFAEYARHYMSTDGQIYWSDTHQLADYPEDYHASIDAVLGPPYGTEMISELFVPRPALPAFMRAVREDARKLAMNVIYGTIRVIENDDETVLAWARAPWACVVFNLHVEHSAAGIATAASHFRRLIDRALEFGGSYYLTYHRWASRSQVETAHPRLGEFLAATQRYEQGALFQSDWYQHHINLLGVSQEHV